MTLPTFSPGDDPGPDFAGLLRRSRPQTAPPVPDGGAASAASPDVRGAVAAGTHLPHGTTVVAVRYAGGVVMAGDRRATAGNFIAHRRIEKVFPADHYSGVAIAGAAGPAEEMVKLFQLQLEHYEKVEGAHLSLDGKANQLSGMVRNHLPAALSGMAVVPLFAGYDTRRELGRLFQYDVTGGRYEEHDHSATGSGSLHASTVVKLGYRDSLAREAAVDLSLQALFQAADEDTATGGPDAIRGIYPVIATISADGFERLGDDEVAGRFEGVLDAFRETQGGQPVPPPEVSEP